MIRPGSFTHLVSVSLALGCLVLCAVAVPLSGAAIPRPEHPRPQLERADWLNLNGPWQFEYDSGLSGEERGLQKSTEPFPLSINVPFCPESRLSGIANTDFMPGVWYRRTVSLPAAWQDKRVILHFGAADYDTKAWLDGEPVGEHRGGYTPFSFEITGKLKPGGSTLTVLCTDDLRAGVQPSGKQCPQYFSAGCSYTRTTGIWQTVWLEAVGSSYVKSFRFYPDISAGAATFSVRVADPAQGLSLHTVISAGGKKVAETRTPAEGTAPFRVRIPKPRLWQVSDPFLYDLEFTIERDGRVIDRVKSYFGLREVTVKGSNLLLNGKKVFQRLVLDQGYYPDGIYTAPTDAALRQDIELAQALGFNGARLHQKVFEPRFLYWADRLGYLCWDEFPNWGLAHSSPATLERVLPEWLAEVERDFNHPAVIMWTPFNETPRDTDRRLLRTVYRVTKALDPTRPVHDVSGYRHVETDIYSVHNYEGDPAKFAAFFEPLKNGGAAWSCDPEHETPYGGQPYIVDEYGGIWWNPGQSGGPAWGYGDRPRSVEQFIARYRGLTDVLLDNPRMFGFCYTQLYDIEQEVNGLYTYERQPKFDPAVIRAINARQAAYEE